MNGRVRMPAAEAAGAAVAAMEWRAAVRASGGAAAGRSLRMAVAALAALCGPALSAADAAAQGRMTQDPIAQTRLAPHLTAADVFPPALGSDHLVVLDRLRSVALLVDPGTLEVVALLPTGPAPDEVTVSPSGRFAYVTHAYGRPGSASEVAPTYAASAYAAPVLAARRGADRDGTAGAAPRGSLTVLDLERLRVQATFQPRAYRPLHGLGLNASGDRLFVTAAADSAILELDARDGSLLMLWRTAGAGGHALATGAAGRKLYVASSGSDSVAVIDRRSVVGHRVAAGAGPVALDLSPDGKELWVANRDDRTITVIDAVRERPVATLSSGGEAPVRVRFRPDGREAWVTHGGSRTVAVFDTERRAKTGEIALPGGPDALLFSPDGERAFVSLPDWGEVAVVDVASRRIVEWIPAGSPGALAWSRRLEAGPGDP